MSTSNTTHNKAARRNDSEDGANDATGGENVHSIAWRLAMGAPMWAVAKNRARFGQLFDAQCFGRIFLKRKMLRYWIAKASVKIRILVLGIVAV